VDAVELASDGTTEFKTGISVVSVVSSTKTVTVSGTSLNEPDYPLEAGDKAVITGNAAAGTYTVVTVSDDTSFTVLEEIADASGGSVRFLYPAGGLRVGVDTTGMAHVSHENVQQALKDLDSSITVGGWITEPQHQALDTLVHELAETAYEEVTRASGRVSTVIAWNAPSKDIKIRETDVTRDGNNQISQVDIKHYTGAGSLKVTLTGVIHRDGNNKFDHIHWTETVA
jgi:hypothetical protein